MTVYSKFNIVYQLQKWLDSVPGQTFLNYAYSWGASIVILGTLFKLTHLPGANIMLYLGMGTEVIVFFISAFDRPFDKTADGKDLPTHYESDDDEAGSETEGEESVTVAGGVAGGGTIIIGGGSVCSADSPDVSDVPPATGGDTSGRVVAGGVIGGVAGGGVVGGVIGGVAGGQAGDVIEGQTDGQTGGVIGGVAQGSPAWVQQQQQVSPEMEEATSNYVDELKRLTEMLGKVSEQSQRLTRDSEEMENLNRTLTGICKVYEMQLKGASAQIGTIDQINEQSRRMAEQIAELNKIYARMIEAMTVNMRAAQNS